MKRGLLLFLLVIWVNLHAILYFSELISFEATLFDFLSLIAFLIIVKKEDADAK